MISLALAAVRLSLVLALIVWLPGWIATRRPFLPLRVLPAMLVGTALHFVALATTTLLTHRVDRATWLLPVASFAIAGIVRALTSRVPAIAKWEPGRVGRIGNVVLVALVVVAAVLRAFHNYHYDDLQHLLYLTELDRQNELFPPEFTLSLATLTLPSLGQGSIMLGRYPFWAVSYTLIHHLAGVSSGDTYVLLGLGILALTLWTMAACIARAWSSNAAMVWVLALVAASPFLSDSLLNYGGYPFQTGKLFVMLAATAAVAAWRTRRPEDLVPAACGIFIAPLLHTNNMIGLVAVIALMAPMLSIGTLRSGIRLSAAALCLIGVVAVGSMLTDGFTRWMPESRFVIRREAAPSTPPVALSEVGKLPAPVIEKDPVVRRLALFVWRGVPWELIVAALAVGIVARGRSPGGGDAGRSYRVALVATAAGVAIAATASIDFVRQVVTSALKPGYVFQRSRLLSIAGDIDPSRPLVTDPITDVMGRAAGWRLATVPPLSSEAQTSRILLMHPDVRGAALDQVLAGAGPATIVINEQVVGPGVIDKFRTVGTVETVTSRGSPVPDAAEVRQHVNALIAAVENLDAPGLGVAPAFVKDVVTLLWRRPLEVLRYSGPAATLSPSSLGRAIRGADVHSAGPFDSQPFLGSTLLTLAPAAGCVDGFDVSVTNRATFDSPVVMWPLDTFGQRTTGVEYRTLGTQGSSATMPVRFAQPVCDGGAFTVLLHGSYWWDFRFDVTEARWKLSRQ